MASESGQSATVRADGATIRVATPADVPALSDLATRTWSEAFGSSVSSDDEAAELEKTRSERYFVDALRDKTILVAEADGALLGYVQFGDVEIPGVEAQAGDQGLHRAYVDSAAQGRGLGRALLSAALEHPRLVAASRIFLTVWDRNYRAVDLYRSYGFRTVGTTKLTIGSEVVEDLVMRLDKTP
jgi:ribosomal protein S18 acetylase RimI-like enzyme